jgi:8-oxo-dGTP pyrophosphatase MutT (NUDIX family)
MIKNIKRASVGLIRNNQDRILMGKRNDTDKWTVPAGKLKHKECPYEGMARELKEETGLDAKEIKLRKVIFENNILLYLFEIKIDSDQKIDTSNDPDQECNEWTYEDPFDHIHELHIPANKNLALRYWAKTGEL